MAIRSRVVLELSSLGDLNQVQRFITGENTAGAGGIDVVTLAAGFTSVPVPTGGTTPRGVLLVPPAGNTVQLTLKGATGDTGVALHLTDPSYLSLAPTQSAIGLTAAAQLVGLRLLWN